MFVIKLSNMKNNFYALFFLSFLLVVDIKAKGPDGTLRNLGAIKVKVI